MPLGQDICLPLTEARSKEFNSFARRLRTAAREMGGMVWVTQTRIESEAVAFVSWSKAPEWLEEAPPREDYPVLAQEVYSPEGWYRIRYFPESISKREILTGTPIPGEGRLVIPKPHFPFYKEAL